MIRTDGIEIDRRRQIIRHQGREKIFRQGMYGGMRPVAFRFWEALILGDCTREQLFNILYDHDSNGGPIQGYNILNVRISMWQKQFADMKLKWRSDKRGGLAHWRLIPSIDESAL